MFSVAPLTPDSALAYMGLAPFEVRHVLRNLGALPRVHAVGATLFGRPVGLGIAVSGWAGAGEFGGAAPEATSGRVLAITVAKSYRRIGIGSALLAALEESLASRGVRAIICNYALESYEGRNAFEALLGKAAWGAPELTMLQCRARRGILESPLMREQIALPPEYEIVDWVDLTREERDTIRSKQGLEQWYPPTLDPFHFEPDLEILNSLALRYHGEVVGWLITRRTSPTTMYYRCLFVRTDLAKLGRGLALICEAIQRHSDLIGSKPGLGEWSTPASLPAMIRFIKRHLAPYDTQVIEQRIMRKQLDGARTPTASRTALREVQRINALATEECDAALATVRSLRNLWTERADPFAFHTLGATARIDAFDGEATYRAASARTSHAMRTQLSSLYERIGSALASALGSPVVLHDEWAPPAVHVIGPSRGADLPLAPVHCDVEHQYLNPGAVYDRRPISFSVCLSSTARSAGMEFWDAGYDETIGLDTEETARLLESVRKTSQNTDRGDLLLYASDQFHQVKPLSDRNDATERVSVEGEAVFIDGIWRMFG